MKDEAVTEPANPVCARCNDTHEMTLHRDGHEDRKVSCTGCPTPCDNCRGRVKGGGYTAFCATTPCPCACHAARPKTDERIWELLAVAGLKVTGSTRQLSGTEVRDELDEDERRLVAAFYEVVRSERDAEVGRLIQVAVEAIRLVHGKQLGDRYSHEACGECGLGGEGNIRDALVKAFGPGYTKLVWGNDMNVDRETLELALRAVSERTKP